jgi:hypothetical protein
LNDATADADEQNDGGYAEGPGLGFGDGRDVAGFEFSVSLRKEPSALKPA